MDASSFIIGSPGQPFASSLQNRQLVDFILCIGDDRMDEAMFAYFRQDEGHRRTSSYSGTESSFSGTELLDNYPPLSPLSEMNTGFGI
jgi:trehalose-6-phosphatase